MLDSLVKPRLDPHLDRAGRALAARGVSANAVTLVGLVLGLAAAAAVASGAFAAALILLALNRLADGLDGAVARATGGSDFGGYWDIVADFIVYAAFPLAFVFLDPRSNGPAGAVLLAGFYINGSTFLGYAILAERQRMRSEARGKKNFYHSVGLLEGTETIAFFVLLCLWPAGFPTLATGFALLCLLSALLRILQARRRFDG